jgi:hypothetical protein
VMRVNSMPVIFAEVNASRTSWDVSTQPLPSGLNTSLPPHVSGGKRTPIRCGIALPCGTGGGSTMTGLSSSSIGPQRPVTPNP